MADLKCVLGLQQRRWTRPAIVILTWVVVAPVATFSMTAATWLIEKLSAFIGRHGYKVVVE